LVLTAVRLKREKVRLKPDTTIDSCRAPPSHAPGSFEMANE